MKIGCVDTIKFKRLKRRLRLPEWQVVGILESLWRFTARNAPAGDIGRWSNDDIAAAMEYGEDADQLIDALIEEHWIDRCDTHRLVVHDWHEHSPTWVKGVSARGGQPEQTANPTRTDRPTKSRTQSATKSGTELPTESETKSETQFGTKLATTIPSHSLPYHTTPTKEPTTHSSDSSNPSPATESPATSWGGVAEAMKVFGVKRPSTAIEAAKSNGFVVPQVLALIDWLRAQPPGSYEPGALVERLSCADAAEWEAHQNWPNPQGTRVSSTEPAGGSIYEPSRGQQALQERNAQERRRKHQAKAREIERLELQYGDSLDAMDDTAFAQSFSDMPSVVRRQIEQSGRGRDSPVRGVLLQHFARNIPMNITKDVPAQSPEPVQEPVLS